MSARLEPSQSSDGSPDAFRNGRIASVTAGVPAVTGLDEGLVVNFSRKTRPSTINKTAAAPMANHFPNGAALRSRRCIGVAAEIELPASHASKSFANSATL